MSDKSWLCVICGHHIRQDDEGQLLPEGGRSHIYCMKSKQFGIEFERERIIKLMEKEVRYDFPPIIEMSLESFEALIKEELK